MNAQRWFNVAAAVLLVVLAGFCVFQQRQIQALNRPQEDAFSGGPEVQRLRREVARLRAEYQEEMKKRPPQPEEVQALAKHLGELKSQAAAIAAEFSGRRTGSGEIRRVGGGDVDASGIIPFESLGGGFSDQVAGKGPRWSHSQASGPPDTEGAGDMVTAWAPRSTRMGEQWLQLSYDKPVEISAVNIHETYNPGAISKVAAILPDGTEKVLWSGTAPKGEPPVETSIPVPAGVSSDKIKVYVDTDRVESWPEIDAVELVGADGSRQWATSTSASSYYGDGHGAAYRNLDLLLPE